ncbi:MAG: ribbon-helix-helix domain-containing protein [Bdellovibrionales bacterium]
MRKRSINIHGHQTSISIEEEFWQVLKDIATQEKLSLNKMIAKIDDQRDPLTHNLSSAIRIYILKTLKGN